MKTQTIPIIFLLALGMAPLFSGAQLEKAEFQASGLTCSMCSNAINKALRTIPFVASVTTDLNKNLFEIAFKKNMPVDIDLIKKKVKDAGFSIASFWIIENIQGLPVDNDRHLAIDGLEFHFIQVKPQILHGENRLRVIDRDFLGSKEFKKFSALTAMPCYQTGMMAGCCKSHGGQSQSGRIYHVTI
jgi:copper chaperone CopZ